VLPPLNVWGGGGNERAAAPAARREGTSGRDAGRRSKCGFGGARCFIAKHGPLPTLLVGGGAGAIEGGRHLVSPQDTPLTNLQLTLLNRLGVPVDTLGDSTGQFKELSEL
jgi:hypothetical protein